MTEYCNSSVKLTVPEVGARNATEQSCSPKTSSRQIYTRDKILSHERTYKSDAICFSGQSVHAYNNIGTNEKPGSSIRQHEDFPSYNLIETSYRGSHQYGSKESAEMPIASSCPGLTSVAFQRYLGQRTWNSESLHDEDELEIVNKRKISKSLDLLPIVCNKNKFHAL